MFAPAPDRRRALTVALGGTALLVALTACTPGAEDRHASPDPTTTTSTSTETVHCEDGSVVLDEDRAKVALAGDCTSVEITASGVEATAAGPLESLEISGSVNYFRVDDVASVRFTDTAEGNRVVTPSSPAVDDQGRSDVVAPAPESY